MRELVAIATILAACGGGGGPDKPPDGASVRVDGIATELPLVMATDVAGFVQLSAGGDDGTLLEISFPDDTAPGSHRCDDGPSVGLFVMELTDAAGTRFSSIFPVADPAHDCSFDVVVNAEFLQLAAIAGPLANTDGSAMVLLAAGEFVAPISR